MDGPQKSKRPRKAGSPMPNRSLYRLSLSLFLCLACLAPAQAVQKTNATEVAPKYRPLYEERLYRTERRFGFLAGLDVSKVSLHRKGCFGTCRIENVTLHRSGTALYEGIRHVENMGIHVVPDAGR